MKGRFVVVGDSLLDRDIVGTVDRLMPDAPVPVVEEGESVARPGGAGLAAILAAQEGPVTLVTAVGADEAGQELRALLQQGGVEVLDVGTSGPTAEKVRIRSRGQSMMRLDRGTKRGILGPAGADVAEALDESGTLLVSDYGRGVTAHPQIRELIRSATAERPVVWDPHPKGSDPVPGCALVTPNLAEAQLLTPEIDSEGEDADTARAEALRRRWSVDAVAVTCGSNGALLAGSEGVASIPAPLAVDGDSCGAGDRFAVTATRRLGSGDTPAEAVARAVWEATRFIESGGVSRSQGSTGPAPASDPIELARRVRDAGGVVVATGGCFDVLHAGHVATLESARALGDCLIVCLNSDGSVRRLKGPGRPVHRAEDRARVLLALSCVDAVLVFPELDPRRAIRRIRPHVWAKGGDYAANSLPEADEVASWGGRVEILPYRDGLSTTRILMGMGRR